jgi:hypothetical protein
LRDTFEKTDHHARYFRTGIFLQEMPAGDEVRPFGMRQQLFESRDEGRVVKHVRYYVAASPTT